MTTKEHISKEAMKLALEALEPFTTPNWAGTGVDKSNEAYAAICEALNTPLAEQKSGIKQVIELYDSPEQPAPVAKPHEQEPVPSIIQMLGHCPECGAKAHRFTSPPAQRKPLTDEDIKDVAASCMWWVREQDILDDAIELARAIEAAHGIKGDA